jgi:acyl-CoA thioesterase
MSVIESEIFPLTAVGPGRWTTQAGPEWKNPNGPLWGGYPIGLALTVVGAEPEAVGEPLSISLTYVAALTEGEIEIRTRRLRQGGSIGVWEVDLRPAGADGVSVQAIVTMAKRPATPPFAFAKMPEAPQPETLPSPMSPGGARHFGAQAFERRTSETFPIQPAVSSYSTAWVRPRLGPWDKPMLGMLTDNSPPRAFYALGHTVMTTTLSLTVYLHATAQEVAEAARDWLLVEYEGRVGGGGASDERSSYWRRDGKLLATSEQLVWYREVPRASLE